MSDSDFETEFLTDPRQLGLKLVSLIESQQLSSAVVEQYKWGSNTLDHIFSGSLAPGEESFGKFLGSEELKNCVDAGLHDLRDFWANWQAANLTAVEELPRPTSVVSADTVRQLPSRDSDEFIYVDDVRVDLTNKQVRLFFGAKIFALQDTPKRTSLSDLAKSLGFAKSSFFYNLKDRGSGSLTAKIVRVVAAKYDVSVAYMLKSAVDTVVAPATIFVAEAQVAEAQVAEAQVAEAQVAEAQVAEAGVVIEVSDVTTSDKARVILVEAIKNGKLDNRVAQKMASDMLKGQESDLVALAAFQTVWTLLDVLEVTKVLALKSLPNMDLFHGMSLGDFLDALQLKS